MARTRPRFDIMIDSLRKNNRAARAARNYFFRGFDDNASVLPFIFFFFFIFICFGGPLLTLSDER